MSQHPSHHVSKGKKVVDECDQPKRYRPNFGPPIPTSVVIREPSNPRSLSHGSSDDEDVPSQFAMTFPTCGIITPIVTLERGESSKGRKRSYDSARYASLTAEQRKTRQDRQRARRQSLTPEERQEINARRRACRQSLPPEKRQALLNQRKASYKARRGNICDESIAMRCPALGASSAINRLSGTSVSTTDNGDQGSLLKDVMDVDIIPEPGASTLVSPSSRAPSSTVENGALGTLPNDVMNEGALPTPVVSLAGNQSLITPALTIGTDDDLDNFIKDVMDKDTILEEDMDDEYYMFAGEGVKHRMNLQPTCVRMYIDRFCYESAAYTEADPTT